MSFFGVSEFWCSVFWCSSVQMFPEVVHAQANGLSILTAVASGVLGLFRIGCCSAANRPPLFSAAV